MAKCGICNKRKGKRFCSTINLHICSFCCGSKRKKEIKCFAQCEYLKKGSAYQMEREIANEINAHFNIASEDIFNSDDQRIFEFVGSLEEFFVDQFYKDLKINDENIYVALVKVYAFQTEKNKSLDPCDKCEELIFKKFLILNQASTELSRGLKAKLILRILKSIRTSSGGILGNRNYLEMIYSQFHKDGKWSYVFGKNGH